MSRKRKVCCACGKVIDGIYMTCCGDKHIHHHCYVRQNMPQIAVSLREVAGTLYRHALAAEVIAEIVPPDVAAEIVRTFNRRMLLEWHRDCKVGN